MVDRQAIADWLVGSVQDFNGLVAEMHLFGSVLTDAEPSDVDVLIVFGEWNVGQVCSRLRRQFRCAFNCPLHIQMFHTSQAREGELSAFLTAAQESRRLV